MTQFDFERLAGGIGSVRGWLSMPLLSRSQSFSFFGDEGQLKVSSCLNASRHHSNADMAELTFDAPPAHAAHGAAAVSRATAASEGTGRPGAPRETTAPL